MFINIENHPLQLLIAVGLLLSLARILGGVCQRIGQPTVIGHLASGIFLGPSLLGALWPDLYLSLFPDRPTFSLQLRTLSLFSVLILLFVTGLEVDVALIRRQLKGAMLVAGGALGFSLFGGILFASALPPPLFAEGGHPLASRLIVAISMSICAIPVLARVLIEANIIKRELAQAILASAMLEDITGWALLASAIAISVSDSSGLGVGAAAFTKTIVVALAIFTIGRSVANRLLDKSFHRGGGADGSLALAMVAILFGAALSELAGIEPLPGAFITGILFGLLPRFDKNAHQVLESITSTICAPLFFAIAGRSVNITSLLNLELLPFVLLMPLVAMVSQGLGSFVVNRLILQRDVWSSSFYSCGLLAQGSIGVVVANIALNEGLITPELYSMIIVSAIATSCVGPALLRFCLVRLPEDPEDSLRIRREESGRHSIIDGAQRILVPVRFRGSKDGNPEASFDRSLLFRVCQGRRWDITLISVVAEGDIDLAQRQLASLSERFGDSSVTIRVVVSDRPGDSIIQEASKGYDIIILGTPAPSPERESILFTPLIDYVLRLAPCPVFLLKGIPNVHQARLGRVLVPTNGSQASQRAAEVAFRLVDVERSDVILLKVINQFYQSFDRESFERQKEASRTLLDSLKELANLMGVSARANLRLGLYTDHEILMTAEAEGADLIVLGTSVRLGSTHLYLGPRVERVLLEAPCPVLVINS